MLIGGTNGNDDDDDDGRRWVYVCVLRPLSTRLEYSIATYGNVYRRTSLFAIITEWRLLAFEWFMSLSLPAALQPEQLKRINSNE